jgi:peptidoglycan/xylan/chitin deacetylase (PgdA/CDA1 family)
MRPPREQHKVSGADAAPRVVVARDKRMKIALYKVARSIGMFRLSRILRRRGTLILCYHGVWQGKAGYEGGSMFIRPETFARRMQALRDSGCPVIPLSHAVEALAGSRPLPANAVVVTIDDGWASTYESMLPELTRHNFPATLYCHTGHPGDGSSVLHVLLTYTLAIIANDPLPPDTQKHCHAVMDQELSDADRWASYLAFCKSLQLDPEALTLNRNFAYMTNEELRMLSQSNVDLQLHTHSHTLHDFEPNRIRQEIADNVAALVSRLGCKEKHLVHFCYPSGMYSESAVECLRALGMTSGTTCEAGLATPRSDPLLLPRITDGDQLDDVEFEAELTGFAELMRRGRRLFRLSG